MATRLFPAFPGLWLCPAGLQPPLSGPEVGAGGVPAWQGLLQVLGVSCFNGKGAFGPWVAVITACAGGVEKAGELQGCQDLTWLLLLIPEVSMVGSFAGAVALLSHSCWEPGGMCWHWDPVMPIRAVLGTCCLLQVCL